MAYFRSDIDPEDARFSYPPGGFQLGAATQYYMYNTSLEIDDDTGPNDYHNQDIDHYHPHAYSQTGSFSPVEYSDTSRQSSAFWGSSVNSRGISSITAPDEEAIMSPTGPRCIFYWLDCKYRAYEHDKWLEHIYDHFVLDVRTKRPEFGRMPTSWTCRFRGCGAVMRNDDHQALWDAKMAHIFGHFLNHRGHPEDIEEDAAWLNYYVNMGLRERDDAYGALMAPPAQKPFQEGITVPRRARMLARGHSHQDAPGEPTYPGPRPRPAPDVYGPLPSQHHPPPPEQHPYSYPGSMGPGLYSPPGQHYHSHQGPGQHYPHPGPVDYSRT